MAAAAVTRRDGDEETEVHGMEGGETEAGWLVIQEGRAAPLRMEVQVKTLFPFFHNPRSTVCTNAQTGDALEQSKSTVALIANPIKLTLAALQSYCNYARTTILDI